MLLLVSSINIITVNKAPVIDGYIEPLWQDAKPLCDFTQSMPDEGVQATESTLVYMLTDRENLYIAFLCQSKEIKPKVELAHWDRAVGDKVSLYLDTFGDKQTCYIFSVSAAGNQADGILYQGGRSLDYSYDGIWKAASSVGEDDWIVEMVIPFKTIHYNVGGWGLQLSRWIEKKREDVYFKEISEMKGIQIEDFKSIAGLNLESRGRFIEFYPVVSLLRNHDFNYNSGIDISWDPSTNTSLDITINPDYGQIEADPFQVNLSQYAQYLRERRPFFIEGKEIFNLSQGDGSSWRMS